MCPSMPQTPWRDRGTGTFWHGTAPAPQGYRKVVARRLINDMTGIATFPIRHSRAGGNLG